jgi:hypothetical protein
VAGQGEENMPYAPSLPWASDRFHLKYNTFLI